RRVGSEALLARQPGVQAARIVEGVPVDFHVAAQTEAARNSLALDAVEPDHDGLVLPRREAQRRTAHFPATFPIRKLQNQRLRRIVLALADRNIEGAIGRMNPAMREQPQRALARGVLSQIDLDPVVGHDSLESTALADVEVSAIDGADQLRNVL